MRVEISTNLIWKMLHNYSIHIIFNECKHLLYLLRKNRIFTKLLVKFALNLNFVTCISFFDETAFTQNEITNFHNDHV